MNTLAPFPAEQRAAFLPSIVRLMLGAFLEAEAAAGGTRHVGD